jgi:hypothetical protein
MFTLAIPRSIFNFICSLLVCSAVQKTIRNKKSLLEKRDVHAHEKTLMKKLITYY